MLVALHSGVSRVTGARVESSKFASRPSGDVPITNAPQDVLTHVAMMLRRGQRDGLRLTVAPLPTANGQPASGAYVLRAELGDAEPVSVMMVPADHNPFKLSDAKSVADSIRLGHPAFWLPAIVTLKPLGSKETARDPQTVALHVEAELKRLDKAATDAGKKPLLPWVSGLSVLPYPRKPGAFQVQAQVGGLAGPLVTRDGAHSPVEVLDIIPRRQQPITGRGIERRARRIIRQWQRTLARLQQAKP